ncbi:MAG: hypothetical protein KDA85_16795, partial [Planctomycetaceae bacterium]|nr:hypothetical protein [Planctomycetaceae bacterium]
MSETMLEQRLRNVARRIQKIRVLRKQSICWLLLLVPAIVLCLQLPPAIAMIRTEIWVGLIATVCGILASRMLAGFPTMLETARLIEQKHPELNDVLLTAVRVHATRGQQSPVF